MDQPLQLSQGAFVTFTGTAFRIGHAKDPYRAYEIRRDVLHLIAAFAEPVSPNAVLDRIRLSDAARAALLGLIRDLHADQILVDAGPDSPRADPAAVKTAERELAKITSHMADITALYPDFVRAWRLVAPYTLTSMALGFAWWNACRTVAAAGIPGAAVECGVWRGGSMMLAALALAEEVPARPLYLYDTFDNWSGELALDQDGFLAPAGGTGEALGGQALREGVSQEQVVRRLVDLGYPADAVVAVPGRVQQTLPATAPERIALLRLDTDLYESTKHELEHLYPRLVPGGVLLIDDYGRVDEATKAVDEYFAEHGITMLLNRVDVQGRIGVKLG